MLTLGLWVSTNSWGQKGQLLVFLADMEETTTQDFLTNYQPAFEKFAKQSSIDYKLVDVSRGSPDLITFAPALVFQNHLGRSLYIGRYGYVDKVKTFIRAVKRLPQTDVDNPKTQVMVKKTGRHTLINPVKITELKGEVPANHDATTFLNRAMEAIDRGMIQYDYRPSFLAKRNHRLVYSAFYPYRSPSGKFFLTAELYSQFNCIVPVAKRFDLPFQGSWSGYARVFEQAGRWCAQRIDSLLAAPGGDGLLPLDVPVKGWEELGLGLPEAPGGKGQEKVVEPKPLPLEWVVEGPIEADLPVIGFSFPPPMDYYAGELGGLSGSLKLNSDHDLRRALGRFDAKMSTLTMGDPELDEAIQGMLKMMEFPESRFDFQSITQVENPALAYGFPTQIQAQGVFHFMGVAAPQEVDATLQPMLDDEGLPRVLVNAQFSIRLKEKYGVKGPDGPEEAKDTVVFDLNFLLKPA